MTGTKQRRGDLAIFAGRMALERDRERGAARAAAVFADELPIGSIPRSELQAVLVPLADRFLERSASLRYSDPAGMIRDAETARTLIFLVPSRRYGRRVVIDLRARAVAEEGNAYRVAGDLETAGDALAEAASWARKGTGDPRLLARIGELAASLHGDSRQFRKAIEILVRVQDFYEQLGEYHLAGRALIKQGLFTREAGRPLEAIALLASGFKCLEPGRDLNLELTAIHDLAYCLQEAGCPAEAQKLLAEKRHLYEQLAKPLQMVRLRWLEGKIAFALREDAEAETALCEAKAEFLRLQQSYDAALVSLDLGLLMAKQGRRVELAALVDRMVETFRRLRLRREAIAALVLLRKVCEHPSPEPEALSARIRAAAALLTKPNR